MQRVVVLDNIRSVHNVGSIFRTADGLGIEKLYLCGTTPAPVDRFGRARNDLAKVALGAEKSVAWEYVSETADALRKLKEAGCMLIALEQDDRSQPLSGIKTKTPFALVVGNEVGGLGDEVLKLCDMIAEIPMQGKKESLNVSVAFGIGAYEIIHNAQ